MSVQGLCIGGRVPSRIEGQLELSTSSLEVSSPIPERISKMELLRKLFYPLEVKIVKGNPYGLPIGKIFRGKRKEGDGSPFPIEIHGDRIYQMAENEVEIIRGQS